MPQDFGATSAIQKQEKHLIILSKMDEIQRALEALEGLAQRIEPTPEKAQVGIPPVPPPNLAQFLNHMPSDLMVVADRINKCVEKITSAVL